MYQRKKRPSMSSFIYFTSQTYPAVMKNHVAASPIPLAKFYDRFMPVILLDVIV